MDTKNIQATITMENGGKIELELYPDIAPITVENFVSLAKEGFYNGLIFHRVISGFMIQGGDPMGVGIGGSGKNIRGEFAINGFNNPNSASSQFFIMHADGPFLDGQYAAFGKVTEGISVVDEIASVQTDGQDKPLIDQRIAEISITDM